MVHAAVSARGLFVTLMCGVLTLIPKMAGAQDTVTPPPSPAISAPVTGSAPEPPETIEVFAPRLLKFETQPTNGTLQKVALEGPALYGDLDLRTDAGVVELRSRIRQEAADLCAHLAQIYPVYAAAGTSCVKDAVEDATIRANRVVTQKRESSY